MITMFDFDTEWRESEKNSQKSWTANTEWSKETTENKWLGGIVYEYQSWHPD